MSSKFFLAIGISILLTSSNFNPIISQEYINKQNEGIPSYAKWGRLAMQETKAKYPNDQIVDYLHIGSERKGETTIEKFKLWLKGTDKEFGVFIDIEFNTKTEEVLSVTFTETDR
ncbi:YqzG/YhdC family protein [Oceanobacillus bengalensis]|uniref:DUF3889 domain-containing protein n=2 Tax=Oceanobacillus bengalensis TaxID=1435466 RepID=A0A494YYG1_9BACI|nr:DUF3889 domain-containing protein [Oceanobacillus bengalensis]